MPAEYFNANVNIGKKGNSIQRVSLYACSGSTEGTCELTPIPGYENLLWTDSKFAQFYESGSYPSLSGLTTFITDLTLYKHTYINVKVTSSYNGECILNRMIPITGIPTPTPTPTVTPTPTPVPTDTPTPTPTATPTVTPTPTVNTPTPTPTVTATPTVTPTPTNTPNTTIEPGYYYYALGDCTDLAYSGYTSTITGFGPPIVVPVCMNYQQMAEFYQNNNFAQTNLVIDYNSPCGFGSGYTPSAIARSSIDYANETVFSIGGQCWSVIEANPIYATGWTINLDSYSPYGGTNACYNCTNSNFTGFTFYRYIASKCSDGSPTYVYTTIPYTETPGPIDFNYYPGQVYYLANHDINGAITEQFCATIVSYEGEYNGPKWSDSFGFDWPVGPLTCSGPFTNCSAGDCVTGRTDCYTGEGGNTPTPTPTATGAPTFTPTPTPTTTPIGGSGCATITQVDSNQEITCLSQGPYNNTITRVTATLNAIAGVNVTIMVNATRTYCYGGTTPETYYIVITAGDSSNYVDITTTGYVDCGEGTCQAETISIDSYASITPNYNICGV